MRVSPFSSARSTDRLGQVNAQLTSLLGSLAAPRNGNSQSFQPAHTGVSASQPVTALSTNGAPFSDSLGSLLSSISTAGDSVAESRAALAKVRGHLETILAAATKASQRPDAAERSRSQLTIDRAIAEINRLKSNGSNTSDTSTVSAGFAELVLRGGTSSTIQDDGAFQISGNLGQTLIAVTRGESLAGVAKRVNQLTKETGITALVADGNLVFRSTDTGSNATVSVLPMADQTKVSGVNGQSLLSFVVNRIEPGSHETLTGSVADATVAELFYDGGAAASIFDTGQFLVSGNLGSTTVAFNRDATLASLVNLVNQQTSATGVTAKLSNGQLVFQSLQSGSSAHVSVGLKYNKLSVSGVNGSQVSGFNVLSLAPGTDHTLAGNITRQAKQAEQIYVGQSGRVTATATFNLTGSLGTRAISIQSGESLTDAATRVNAQISSTGVSALVQGDNLIFRSLEYGGDASFSVNVTNLLDVAGVNSNQIVRFDVNSLDPNSNQTVSGTVTAAAERAELKYSGAGGSLVRDDGAFNVTGTLGSASFTVTKNESLSGVATRINQQSGSTGVTATVVNNDMFLRSAAYGASASTLLTVTSGKFDVTGGTSFNGGKIDYGTNVAATINGTSYVGNANLISFNDGFGNFTIEFATGFQGSFAPITAVSAATADSLNVSRLNSSQLTSFQVNSIARGDFQTVSGTVTAAAARALLTYSGSGGSQVKNSATFRLEGDLGSANFTVTKDESLSAVAGRINQQTSATGVTATVVNNDLFLNSANYGSNAKVLVEVTSGLFSVSGGTLTILQPLPLVTAQVAHGTDVAATIKGVNYVGTGNQLSYSQGTGNFTLNFAAGFQGAFDPIRVASTVGANNLTDGQHVNPTGINKSQFVSFQVNSTVPDSVQTVSGSVVTAAQRAELKYSGAAGSLARDNATFSLTGNLGSASITVTKNESLSAVAGRINQQSQVTGVTATVVNNDLFLRSAGYGTSAQTFVKVTSGVFNVSGGTNFNGGQIDYGSDVQATINGVNYVGQGNQLSFSNASGSFSAEFVAGFQGNFDNVAVGSIDNAFNLTGGNGNGTANGVDAQAVINGQTITANINHFSFSDAYGSYTLDTAPGYVGSLDPIRVASTETDYAIQGGDGNGTAIGADSYVVINGQTHAGGQNQYTYDSDTGSYTLEFLPGFSGSFGPIKISTSSGAFQFLGGNGNGTARGTDPVTITAAADIRSPAEVKISVFDQLRHLKTLSLGLDASTLGGPAGRLQQLSTGGSHSGLDDNADHAVRIAQQALAYVSNVESLLERAAAQGANTVSKLPTISPTDAIRTALSVRESIRDTLAVPFRGSSLDPRLVFDLLRAASH